MIRIFQKNIHPWSRPNGKYSCPYCTGFCVGKKEDLKKWKVGKYQRTYRRLVEKHLKFLDPEGGNGVKSNAKKYENCVNMPIRLSQGNDNRPLIHKIAPGPLHCMLIGK